MLKTISAALLAVSVLAAPALAATSDKTAPAPVIKAEQVKQTKAMKPNLLNANARMGHHHFRHAGHYRFHKHYGALKTHKYSKLSGKHFSKVSSKHAPSAIKHG